MYGMEWNIKYYNDSVQKDIMALPPKIQARYIHLTERMLTIGANLGMPHTKAMGGGLFELRIKSVEGIGRVLYCTVVKKKIVMLHSFIKKSQKSPKKELEIAKKRMKEVQSNDDT